MLASRSQPRIVRCGRREKRLGAAVAATAANERTHTHTHTPVFTFLTMGLIFAKLWSFFCNQEHKVIIVGLDNAGKTTILYQFLMNEVVHTSPTIGSNVEEIVVKNTHFLMWDIGGQESLRSSWNTYYSNTEFIILVVDSTDRERLAISKEELYRMLAHEDLRKAAVLIFANKQDMKDCMSAAEISKYLTLSSIKDHPWHIQSCCALTGEGLCQGLEWMTSRAGLR
ncbi:ADP-ribosylation factor-like protein 5B [Solea solea]|nr:ADP-ribosylation factor-like protein 5B [Solea solea]